MHLGRNSIDAKYSLNSNELITIAKCSDLDVLLDIYVYVCSSSKENIGDRNTMRISTLEWKVKFPAQADVHVLAD